ncbi:MAG: phosphatase PAP2 family protein [Pseudolabrys sp.]|nr:phosphatase PAP2 family protein [Pseudolabrys sp.]
MKSGNAGSAAVTVRRCLVNVGVALKTLVRPARVLPVPPPLPSLRQFAVAAAAIVVFLLAGMFVFDAAAINALPRLPRWVVWFFQEITDFGKGAWFLWPLGLLFLFLAALPRTISRFSQGVLDAVMTRVGFLFVAIGLTGLMSAIVKNVIGRARPGVSGTVDPFLFDPLHWAPSYASLPSGHTTTAFAALAAIGMMWPRARTVLLVFAVLIALSRVAIGAHYPTDVLAGAMFGMAGAILVRRWFALRGLVFSFGPDGALHQRPGPSVRRIKSVARELLA